MNKGTNKTAGATPIERPTVKDIARLAKVSIGTVDRVMHRRGRVSRDTENRVLEAARILDYSPNLAASNLSRARHRSFAVLMPELEQDGGYWKIIDSGMQSALGELAHHYVSLRRFHYDRSDNDSLVRAVKELKRCGADGLLFAPTTFPQSHWIVEELGGIPCVVFDGELPGADLVTTINQDSLESGLLAGKLLHLLEPHGPYVTVTIGSADYHLRRRRDGFIRYFSHHGKRKLRHLEFDTTDVGTAIHSSLSDNRNEIRAVFVTNAMAHLVARELNTASGVHVPIVGYDLIPDNEECLRTGQIDFVINQEPWRQGYSSVYALYRHVVLGEAVEPRIRMPVELVMRENLAFHNGGNTDA